MPNIGNTMYNSSNNVLEDLIRSCLLFVSRLKFILPLNLPRINKNYLFVLLDSPVIHYFTPIILTYAWNFRLLAGVCLVILMLSGIFLAIYYTTATFLNRSYHTATLLPSPEWVVGLEKSVH